MKLTNTHFLAQNRRSIIVSVVIVILIVLALWLIPKWQVNTSGINNPKDQFNAENEARKTLAQIVGGAAILIGLFFTWQTVRSQREDLKVTKEGQITERFTRAIDQLGSMKSEDKPNIEVRLGGIYALEKIASDEPENYHGTIMEILTSYVRENAPLPPKESESNKNEKSEVNQTENKKDEPPGLNADIQAILTVIGRRESRYDKTGQFLNLTNTNLEGAILEGANLGKAGLKRANLGGALLGKANLEKAHLGEANLEEANLTGAKLSRAGLWDANLSGASLKGADLRYADLRRAKNITIDQLCRAKTLYEVEMDSELFEGVKQECPQLLKEPKEEE